TLADQLGTAFINTPSSWPLLATRNRTQPLPSQSAQLNPIPFSNYFSTIFYAQDDTVITDIQNQRRALGIPVNAIINLRYSREVSLLYVDIQFTNKSESLAQYQNPIIEQNILRLPKIQGLFSLRVKTEKSYYNPNNSPDDTYWNESAPCDSFPLNYENGDQFDQGQSTQFPALASKPPCAWHLINNSTYKGVDIRTAWKHLFSVNDGLVLGLPIVIAFIDTGYTPHPDIREADLWYNDRSDFDYTKEHRNGKNFCDGEASNDISDTTIGNHGLKTSSIVSAVTNNSKIMSGIASNVKIMHLRVAGCEAADLTAAIDYARTHGATIINFSGHATLIKPSTLVKDSTEQSKAQEKIDTLNNAISNFKNAKGTLVVAAGNDDLDFSTEAAIEVDPIKIKLSNYLHYPQNSPNVIVVGSTDKDGNRATFSNYSTSTEKPLTIMAPGKDVLVAIKSIYIANANDIAVPTSIKKLFLIDQAFQDEGTSYSAPIVSGIIALIQSKHLYYRFDAASFPDVNEIKKHLKIFANSNQNDTQKYGAGIIDAGSTVSDYVPSVTPANAFSYPASSFTKGDSQPLLPSKGTSYRNYGIYNFLVSRSWGVSYTVITGSDLCTVNTVTGSLTFDFTKYSFENRTCTIREEVSFANSYESSVSDTSTTDVQRQYSYFTVTLYDPNVKVDNDGNGLIEISNQKFLDAIRYNTNGTSLIINGVSYTGGCPSSGCYGYELTNDITVNNWNPIGPGRNSMPVFKSTFDGKYHTITINDNNQKPETANQDTYYGLFAATSETAVIKNLHVNYNSTITFDNTPNGENPILIGPVAARNAGIIINVRTTGSINHTYPGLYRVFAGGIVGSNEKNGIRTCIAADTNCSPDKSVSYLTINLNATFSSRNNQPHLFAGGIVGRDKVNTREQIAANASYAGGLNYINWSDNTEVSPLAGEDVSGETNSLSYIENWRMRCGGYIIRTKREFGIPYAVVEYDNDNWSYYTFPGGPSLRKCEGIRPTRDLRLDSYWGRFISDRSSVKSTTGNYLISVKSQCNSNDCLRDIITTSNNGNPNSTTVKNINLQLQSDSILGYFYNCMQKRPNPILYLYSTNNSNNLNCN
ncbi:MAG: S8 family serine peptidase, partial [Methylacidiphilales bacterium]|nr:S8 family serine peptidase [Candidatus Methylacidiphilales bacterium]